jgi:transcriptional regulator with XRE-family HTH domain
LDVQIFNIDVSCIIIDDAATMITAGQMRAARALLDIDQRKLADLSGLSLPTIQRMESSKHVIRGNVDSLMKLVAALDAAGIELIGEAATSTSSGRGVRLKEKVVPESEPGGSPDRNSGTAEG